MHAVCPKCNVLNPMENKFCGSCGASLESAALVKPVERTGQGMQSSRQEITYYSSGDVLVTSARAVFGATTYTMANITSVNVGVIPANRTAGVVTGLIGLLVFLVGLTLIASGNTPGGILALLVGGAIAGISVFWAVNVAFTYLMKIVSASGEAEVLASTDWGYVERIVRAMERAIAERS